MRTVRERLMGRVERRDDGCWVFGGYLDRDGYGVVRVAGKARRAHRVSWEIECGEIPAGHEIDHVCRNRACVNPAHLRVVTPSQHAAITGAFWERAAQLKRARTHCKHGHPFDDTNTRRDQRGHRACRACVNATSKRYAARKKAAS